MSQPSSAWLTTTTSFPGSCPCTYSVLGQGDSRSQTKLCPRGQLVDRDPRSLPLCVRSSVCGLQKGVGTRRRGKERAGGRNQLGQAEGQDVEGSEDRRRGERAQKARLRTESNLQGS